MCGFEKLQTCIAQDTGHASLITTTAHENLNEDLDITLSNFFRY